MKDTITIRIPDSLLKELEDISVIEKKAKSDIIRSAIARYLALMRYKQIRRNILPFAEKEGLLTDEDIFKAIS